MANGKVYDTGNDGEYQMKDNDLGKVINSHTVRLERVLPGPIERVFDYLSKPELLSKWLMPAMLEARVGGRIQLKSEPIPESIAAPPEHKPQECLIRGIITHYDPPRLISYSWNETNYAVSTEVKFELEERGDEVFLVLTHSRLPASFMAAVAAGWHTNLETVLALLTGETPSEFFSRFNPRLEQYQLAFAAAGIVAASSGTQALASNDPAQDLIRVARVQLLTQYDRTWKDADDIEYKIDQLEKSTSRDKDKDLDYLSRELKKTYDDLHKMEMQLRDLDHALR